MIRFAIHGEAIEVVNADAASALRRALDKVSEAARIEEREACAKIADAYEQENIERGDALCNQGQRSRGSDAFCYASGARIVAGLIRARGKATKQEG